MSCFSSPPQQSTPPPVFRLFCRFSFVGIIVDNVGSAGEWYYWGRLILHFPAGPMIIFINGGGDYPPHHFGKDLFDSIRSSIFLGDSKPGRRRLFTFRICLFVVGLCRTVQFVPKKKSPLQNFSFLAHPSLYLFPHFSLS